MIQLLNSALEKYQFCLLSDLPAITQSLYFTLLRRILVNYRHLGLKIHDFYAERNLFHRSSMLLLFKLSFVLLVLLFALFGVCFFACLFYQKHGCQHHPHADRIFVLFCFGTDETATFASLGPPRNLVFDTCIPAACFSIVLEIPRFKLHYSIHHVLNGIQCIEKFSPIYLFQKTRALKLLSIDV